MVAQNLRRKGLNALSLALALAALAGGGTYLLTQPKLWGDDMRSGAKIDVTVNSVDGLLNALRRAGNGSVIKLAPGDYPDIVIKDFNFSGKVTITSAQADRPARILRMLVQKSGGLVFRNLELAAQDGSVRDLPFRFVKVQGLTLDHLFVHGPDNLDSAMLIPGLMLRDSENVTLSNSRFTRLLHAVQILEVKDLQVTANDFWNLRSDGVRGGGITNALYANNVCSEFHPVVPDHPDCIQIWSTNAAEPGRNIVIRDNLVVRAKGDPTQGIFVRDTFSKMPFENLEISGNLVIGTLFNGIAVDGVNSGKVLGNEAVAVDGQKTWIRLQRAQNVELRGNLAPKVLLLASNDIKDSSNRFNQGVSPSYRQKLVKWLEAKPERWRKDSELLQKLVATAP
jgi:hypothetical protein